MESQHRVLLLKEELTEPREVSMNENDFQNPQLIKIAVIVIAVLAVIAFLSSDLSGLWQWLTT